MITQSPRILKDMLYLTIVLSIFFGLFLGHRPLSVPDEGRYTEIPREMVESGDYITPRLNGVKYFEKPPLMYWLTALSLKAFGIKEGAMRLWPMIFGILGSLATYLFGSFIYNRTAGIASASILATTLLYYAHSRILILDMAVSVFLTLSLYSFFAALFTSNLLHKKVFITLFFSCCAGAFLTKGLIGIALPGSILLIWSLVFKDYRIFKVAFNPWGLCLFFLITAPWHVLAAKRTPEFLEFYFLHEQFLRFLTTVHKRYQPFWFFMPVILVGFFPWTGFLGHAFYEGLKSLKDNSFQKVANGYLLIWIGLIFMFFSLSNSKLIPYILPVFPPLSLLTGKLVASLWESPNKLSSKLPFFAFQGFCFALLIALPITLKDNDFLRDPKVLPYSIFLGICLLVGSLSVFILHRLHHIKGALITIGLTGVLMFIPMNLPWGHLEGRSIKPLALALKERLTPQDLVVTYHRYYQDLPPYIGRRVFVVEWYGELYFGTTIEDTSSWMLTEKDFGKLLISSKRLFIVTRKSFVKDLKTRHRLNNLHIIAQTDKDVVLAIEN